jgi:hypothetical protein
MTRLLPRHVDTTEAARLGIPSGWYATKVSGTFVAGPHPTEEGCLQDIARIGPLDQDRRI